MKLKDNSVRTISKAVSIQVAPVKKTEKQCKNAIANQLKFVILLAAGLGLNRIYLLNYPRLIKWLFGFYCAFINVVTVYTLITTDVGSASYKVLRDTGCLEYILLVFIVIFSKKSSLRNVFDGLWNFDDSLNIQDDLNLTFSITKEVIWIVVSIFYAMVEFIYIIIYVYDETMSELTTTILSYITFMTHDIEHILFCTLLRTIFMRVRILKSHVTKELAAGKEIKTKSDKIEALSNKAQLDINSLHRNYELLHKCAEQLNSIMSLPMMIMLLSSGLSSIMLLKVLFRVLQTTVDQEMEKMIIWYSITRCMKYTFLVIVPCYFSSKTNSQVSQIRIKLHDAMNSDKIDKLERRRIKAFFQLTRESEFTYALWGVIRLNMSLPLSYLSLCTTYLVIIIQFSKFID